MRTITQRPDQRPRNLPDLLPLLLGACHGIAAAWNRLMERNAARGRPHGEDDIAWVSGEPDEPAGH